MLKPLVLSLLQVLLLQTLALTLAISTPLFNISHFSYPKIGEELRPEPSLFLKDVLDVISEWQKWNLEDIRVSKLDVRKAKYGTLQRYEIRIRFGKGKLVFKLLDEESVWKKFKTGRGDFESLVKEVGSKAVLDAFRVQGPFELRVGGDDELSLMLPLNTTHTGLKRILVGEGITLEVRGAQEMSLYHASDLQQQVNGSTLVDRARNNFGSFLHSLCMRLLPLRVLGSASVVAYKTQNPDTYVETAFLSRETIELLPAKCYIRHMYKQRGCPIDSLGLRIALLGKIFRSLKLNRTNQNAILGFVNAKIKASTIFSFQLEIERDIRSNDTFWSTVAEWRTRPIVESAWFEVVARIEAERLKPFVVKKMKPFTVVESSAWSNLMSNVSFTNIPPILVPPEALTLDVKW
ncbi:unnamed protein product [Ilex paraguariensis]|uniref:Uncharacterized protein n=1 Tax=Ilex paraguariensis TaxID=185542 RepID=A0ABC8SF89_9AQUA